jgi:hypothetical protein
MQGFTQFFGIANSMAVISLFLQEILSGFKKDFFVVGQKDVTQSEGHTGFLSEKRLSSWLHLSAGFVNDFLIEIQEGLSLRDPGK